MLTLPDFILLQVKQVVRCKIVMVIGISQCETLVEHKIDSEYGMNLKDVKRVLFKIINLLSLVLILSYYS